MAAKKKVTDDQPTPDAQSVVNNANRAEYGGVRAAQHGQFCRVVDGDEAGRYGVLLETITSLPDGTPDDVLIQTRDDDSMLLSVKYADLSPADPGGR